MLIAGFILAILLYIVGSMMEGREKAKSRAYRQQIYDDFCRKYPDHIHLMDHFLDD